MSRIKLWQYLRILLQFCFFSGLKHLIVVTNNLFKISQDHPTQNVQHKNKTRKIQIKSIAWALECTSFSSCCKETLNVLFFSHPKTEEQEEGNRKKIAWQRGTKPRFYSDLARVLAKMGVLKPKTSFPCWAFYYYWVADLIARFADLMADGYAQFARWGNQEPLFDRFCSCWLVTDLCDGILLRYFDGSCMRIWQRSVYMLQLICESGEYVY